VKALFVEDSNPLRAAAGLALFIILNCHHLALGIEPELVDATWKF
jgi:hypothetical protein